MCRGIDHAEVEVIGRVEEVDVCVVDLVICAKTYCVDESPMNVSQFGIWAVIILAGSLDRASRYGGIFLVYHFPFTVEAFRDEVRHAPSPLPVARYNIGFDGKSGRGDKGEFED